MRLLRFLNAALLGLLLGGCTGTSPPSREREDVSDPADVFASLKAFAEDPAVARAALERSLVTRDNGYARLRLENYDEAHWGALPEFNPRTTPMRPDGAGLADAPSLEDAAWSSLDVSGALDAMDALRALGERAFYTFPTQAGPGLPGALREPDRAGVWSHQGRFGAVWTALPNGVVSSSLTCATCHAEVDGDVLVSGRNNAALHADRLFTNGVDGFGWGPGRVDVTNDDALNPVAITDLRPVAYQKHLHHAATLVNDPQALAVRIETLMITSLGQRVRPPRIVAAGLAAYLLSLAGSAPLPEGDGLSVFNRECVRCHAAEGRVGPPVSLEEIGTDPSVGQSSERGTGAYRVPSLRHVGDRRRLFASGDVDDVVMLLDPKRTATGHRFGFALTDGERAALLDYLRAL